MMLNGAFSTTKNLTKKFHFCVNLKIKFYLNKKLKHFILKHNIKKPATPKNRWFKINHVFTGYSVLEIGYQSIN